MDMAPRAALVSVAGLGADDDDGTTSTRAGADAQAARHGARDRLTRGCMVGSPAAQRGPVRRRRIVDAAAQHPHIGAVERPRDRLLHRAVSAGARRSTCG